MNRASLIGAAALAFSSMAFAQGHSADVPPQLTDDEQKTVQLFRSFSQCVHQKRVEIGNEARAILARDPADIEAIIREDGRNLGQTQDNIDNRIKFFRALDRQGKDEWVADFLSWVRDPQSACINDLGIDRVRDDQKLQDMIKKYGIRVLYAGPQ